MKITTALRAALLGAVALVAGSALALQPAAAPPPDTGPNGQAHSPAITGVPRVGHPGEAIYQHNCAACHDHPEASRAPSRDNLAAMSPSALTYALTEGKMKAQGSGLTEEMRGQVIAYLKGDNAKAAADDWTPRALCKGAGRADLSGAPTVTGFGFNAANTRALSAGQAGLSKASLSGLKPAWAMGFPNATTMRSQPAIVGTTAFLPVAESGKVYALSLKDPAKPCVQWVYASPGKAPLRTSAAYGVLADGRKVVAVASFDATVHLIDAETGKGLWTKSVKLYNYSFTTGTPRVLRDRIIVPVSQYEIVVGGSTKVTCCTNHGAVLSLDPKDGAQQWRYDTMPEAKPVKDRGDGKMLWGPSGAPIWTSPLVDEKRGLVFIGTGEANSEPAHKNTDAVIAIRLKDGTEAWSMQATERDIYDEGCGPKPRADQLNCSHDTVYRDVDFGASMVMARLSDGRELVLAGQKSGAVWALDPGTGKVVWHTDIGAGSPLGGVHWGMAYDADTVFVPISFTGPRIGKTDSAPVDPRVKPGLHALDARTGKEKWAYVVTPDCAAARKAEAPLCQVFYSFSAAPTVVDGAVLQGALDGRVYAFDAKTGAVLWTFDALGKHAGVNGVDVKAGSIDGPGLTVGGGLVLVNAGYGMFGQVAGNGLLAFRPGG